MASSGDAEGSHEIPESQTPSNGIESIALL